MRILARAAGAVAVVVAAAVVVAGATVAVTVRRPFPDHDGRVVLQGLTGPVEVRRDARGVPHVEAGTTADLFFAQGYVTAQDRFFEMDVRRHVAAGRLSELVGADPDALAADRVIRTMGWRRVAEQEARAMPAPDSAVLEAYSAGVNAYLEGRSPGEVSVAYSVLGLQLPLRRIERWTPVDSLSWLKAIAWELSSNRTEEAVRALLLADGLPASQVAQLLPEYPADRPTIVEGRPGPAPGTPTAGADDAAESGTAAAGAATAPAAAVPALRSALAAVTAVPTTVGGPGTGGSNSWVVSGEHTASGRPLLANDPHLGPSVPSVWYQVGLRCRELGAECPYEVSGFAFAGVPGVLIGRNARVAWGLTTMYTDDADYVVERVVRGTRYVVDGAERPMRVRSEVIRVAGGDDVPLTVRTTRHGPVVSDVLDGAGAVAGAAPLPGSPPSGRGGAGEYAVSLAWTGSEPGRTFQALLAVNTSRDWESFRAAAALLDSPGQNLVYADVDGRIGYQSPGLVPVRGAGDGRLPAPGWDARSGWRGWVPFERMPSVTDPPAGYLVTANNKVTRDPAAPYLGSDTAHGARAARIDDELARLVARGGVTAAELAELQVDDVSPLAADLVPALLEVDGLDPFTEEAVDLLRGWDGGTPGDSAAAAYAHAVWERVLALTFHDEIPEGWRPSGSDRDLVAVRALLAEPSAAWWDDVTTPRVVEGRDDVLARALTEARLDLTRSLAKDPRDWRWDRLHVLRARQLPLGSDGVPWPVRRFVNLGEVGLAGSSDAVNATGFDAATGSFEVTAVPSLRMVVDLGDPDGGTWVHTTGASGHPGHPHYGDQRDAWARGETFAWPFSADAVREAERDLLVLEPPG
ncbi:MAG: penicillin acylase family protein [Kineosporiaceae bacterium]